MSEETVLTLEGDELTFEHDLSDWVLSELMRLINNRPAHLMEQFINSYGGKVI